MPASHLVIRCSDYRLSHAVVHFMKNLGLIDRYEDVAAAGGVKNLVDPYDSTDPEFVLRQLAIARKLHGLKDVVLINHLGCETYGQGTFTNLEEERDRHVRDLNAAQQMIEHRFEGMNVVKVLGRIDDEGKVDFEKIV